MKWDIDKALQALEASDTSGTLLERALINPEDGVLLSQLKLKLTPAHRAKMREGGLQAASAWVLGVGKVGQRKLFFHGWTIRDAYLRARRELKKMSKSDLVWYGLSEPKKPGNSFATARRKAKSRSKP